MAFAAQSLTVGTQPVQCPIVLAPAGVAPQLGLKALARNGNSGNVYYGTFAQVSISTGVLVAQGTPAASIPTVIPAAAFDSRSSDGLANLWFVADAAGQIIDLSVA